MMNGPIIRQLFERENREETKKKILEKQFQDLFTLSKDFALPVYYVSEEFKAHLESNSVITI